MPAYIKPLLDAEENIIYPPTKATAVYMSDNTTTAETAINNKVTQVDYNASIGTTWSGEGPYTQTVSVPGILAADKVIVDINFSIVSFDSIEAVNTAWASVYRISVADNVITVYATESTETSVPITLTCLRKD